MLQPAKLLFFPASAGLLLVPGNWATGGKEGECSGSSWRARRKFSPWGRPAACPDSGKHPRSTESPSGVCGVKRDWCGLSAPLDSALSPTSPALQKLGTVGIAACCAALSTFRLFVEGHCPPVVGCFGDTSSMKDRARGATARLLGPVQCLTGKHSSTSHASLSSSRSGTGWIGY